MMHGNQKKFLASGWATAALSLVLAALGILYVGQAGTKWIALLAGAAIVVLLLRGDGKRLWNLPALLLLGYAAFSWLTVFWAMSGKFHLREGSKILVAVLVFLLVVLHKKRDGAYVRRVMTVIAGVAAICAALSVVAGGFSVLNKALQSLPGFDGLLIAFGGSRLSGIFGNSNIESSVYAAGIFCALGVLCGAEKKSERVVLSVLLAVNAFAFLLVFSMGAIVCFVVAVIAYLVFAGNGRAAALVRMLEVGLPTLACGFVAFRLFSMRQTAAVTAVMLADAAVVAALELTVGGRLSAALAKREKLVFGAIAAVAVCAVVYVVAGMQLTGPYTFGAEIGRSAQLSAGEHTFTVEADGAVSVYLYSCDELDLLNSTQTSLYSGPVEGAVSFTVPEGSEIVFARLSAEPGVTVTHAWIDGTQELPLGYKILPGFAANRIQYIGASTSETQRATFRMDALKLFRLSPVVGNGVGAFETGVTRVQDYPYETKFVHNHYLQILLEDGVIGFALFVGALAALAVALWKKRRVLGEGEYAALYPALCAAFVMNDAQMLWDVSMSMVVFTCMTYAIYGLLVALCAEPFGEKEEAAAAGKKKKTARRADPVRTAQRVGAAFAAVVTLTLAGNLYAGLKMSEKVETVDDFLGNMAFAARIDLYERNDEMLSYVMAQGQGESDHREQADAYAAKLARAQSNTIPRYLVNYYLQTEQYEAAIDEAILGATYSASNADTWNSCAEQLKQAFLDSTMFSPLLYDRETLMPKLLDYCAALNDYNASARVPVTVNVEAQAFFDQISALGAVMNDDEAFAELLLVSEP